MKVDPIELELMRNLFEAAAEEMGVVLQRASFSANIKERRDFSCAIFDAEGQLLSQAAHIPVHLGSMPQSVGVVLERLGRLDDGDVAIVNDPFEGGTHLPDITVITPVYLNGALLGFAANRAHHADVGGTSPGSMTLSRHIDEEGLRLGPRRLIERGHRNQAVFDRVLLAVRTPDERLGDLEAQLASNEVGARALRRIAERSGVDVMRGYGLALLDYSQSFMVKAIGEMPDGTWEFADVMDDDGAGGRATIHAVLTIAGERATVDLRGSSDQVGGCINCPQAVALSAVYYCFGCLLQGAVPLNGGCFRNIDVMTRAGSVVHAIHPAAVVAGNTETSQRIVDVVFGAMAQALPDRIPAASCGTMSSLALGGDGWTYYETIGGGCGAGPGWDGESAIQCHMTNTLNTPAEALEMQYPLRVRRFERAGGSGGHGHFNGGDGIVREIEALSRCSGTVLSTRRASAPYGLAGGSPAKPGRNVRAAASAEINLAGMSQFELFPGDRIRIVTPGGGGFGLRR
jgi:N-methylhydantoinase B